MHINARLLTPDEYLANATQVIDRAHTSVNLLTMVLVEDKITHPFVDALCHAARRGIPVTVSADMFTYSDIGGHFKLHSRNSKAIRHITTMQHKLQKAGVKFYWLGTKASSLVSGRTHTKWLVVDDTVYSFGGVNIYDKGIQNTDYMFHIKDIGLASHLVAEHKRIIEADRYSNVYRSHQFGDDTNMVLIDGGLLGDSIIYRHACRLTEKAEKVVYVSQYCPTGKLGRLLKRSNPTLYFNPWNKANSLNAFAIRIGGWLSGLKSEYTRSNYLHAKLMIFYLPDGEKVAITGSHNFSHAGVWLGTREVALETRDKRIIKQLESFVRTHVA